ncbi:K(+) efflux antiporter 3, chloroplastic-like [Panicum virgatum]|uniref:K(+) efflux antiporter 3, chloroplastic-like n=1 Tax=Panicum virgatum TaxID=38727 RepID=UPI0019D56AE3|nr:K(+) efflux antiporter 3, chloroplastic-like [Panicum virgatum]
MRRVFEFVAESRSSEAFVALCLLTVAGTSLITQQLGFSDTLGAFLAGAILAETNFRTQIEADIRPFRGLLLGLFFVTTGTSIDMQLLIREWPNVLSLLGGLIAIKTLIITAIGPRVGLTLQESVRIGLLLSQGGEFGFVVFSLANRLGVLPLELNKLLIIVVVLSMALTPNKQVVVSIEMHSDLNKMSVEELIGRLRVAKNTDAEEAADNIKKGVQQLLLTEEQWEACRRQRGGKERARGGSSGHGGECDEDDGNNTCSGAESI